MIQGGGNTGFTTLERGEQRRLKRNVQGGRGQKERRRSVVDSKLKWDFVVKHGGGH